MKADGPSRTALSAARLRAWHQVADGAAIHVDPLVARLLPPDDGAAESLTAGQADGAARLRWFIAARSRYAEDRALAAVATGVRQVVVLGAGLDTFAYRLPRESPAVVFEVDHPATQAWKRERLAAAGIDTGRAVFVPVDFEHDDVLAQLSACGFDPGAPAVFLWLGVLPYLTLPAVEATLRTVARVPGAQVVLDYGEPAADLDPERRASRTAGAERAAAAGEPWLTFLAPAQLRDLLARVGLRLVEDVDAATLIRSLLGQPAEPGQRSSAHVVHAVV